MVVERRHADDALPGHLETRDLGDHRNRLDDKDQRQQREVPEKAGGDGGRYHRRAKRETAGVTHEDPRGKEVVEEKADQAARQNRRQQPDARLMLQDRDQGEGAETDGTGSGGQAVAAVRQVEGVGPGGNREGADQDHPVADRMPAVEGHQL